ncbi:MAG: NADH-quinone oxidoreductase subunit N [Pleurocapsa sp. SU_196_0]|nr:NADH-quinone oxidoreductase subunit N [Pleurocapsa sp. SU_196_0]
MLFALLVFLTVSGIATFLAATSKGADAPGAGQIFGGITIAVFGLTALLAVLGWNDTSTYYGVLKSSQLTSIGVVLLSMIGMLTTAGVMANPDKYRAGVGEFFGFVIFTVLGGIIMVGTNNLLVLLLGLELSSYSTYILVGYYRDDRYSNEAASKYFLLGAVASALLAFGMSFVYGAVAFAGAGVEAISLNYADIGNALVQSANGVPALMFPGLALMLVGFGFKLALVPFHSWTPDAYQGSPSMVAALLSVGPKAAVVIALSTLLTTAFPIPQIAPAWQQALAWMAILSMTVGNLQAIQQRNVKRLLGYSSIAQLGYVVIGIAVGSSQGTAALVLYMVGYAITNIGAFTTIAALRDAGVNDDIEDYAGLVRRSPVSGILLVGFFMGLAGVPFLAGFLGKLLLLKSAIDAGLVLLAVVAALNIVPSYYYYFRVIIQAIFAEPRDSRRFELNPTAVTVLSVALIGAVFLGVYPTPVLNAIDEAVKALPLFAAR